MTALLQRRVQPEMLVVAGIADSRPEHRGTETYPPELDRRVTFKVSLLPIGPEDRTDTMIQKKICMVGTFGVGKTSLVAAVM